MDIDYSVIIRTIGKANEKYQKLLDSIANLSPQPKEVIVVLPEGYELPEQQLGWETFFYSKKGMVSQRMYGITVCKTQYALICDDDVNFETDFVQKLHEPLEQRIGSLSIAPLYSFLPPKGFKTFIGALLGTAAPTVFHKNNYCTILRGAGYSFNRNLKENRKYYFTQSAAWTCFYANIDELKKVRFEDEKWLEMNNYAAIDDTVMFYKAYLMGYKTIVVTNASYEHADAKTSTRNNQEVVKFCSAFNMVVFWHRFIYLSQKNAIGRFSARICFAYKKMCTILYEWIYYILKRNDKQCLDLTKKGMKDAYEYIGSKEYSLLPDYRLKR